MCHALAFSSIANLMHVLLKNAPILDQGHEKYRSETAKQRFKSSKTHLNAPRADTPDPPPGMALRTIHGTTPKRYLP